MKPARGTLRVFETGEALAQATAAWLVDRALAHSGRFVLNLSGGSTPKRAYAILGSEPHLSRFPWGRTHFVFGDERFVPHNDADSNAGMAESAMLGKAPVPKGNIHAVPTEGLTAQQAASQYEATLKALYGADKLTPGRPLCDVTLLGLGDDGHTASLLPGDPLLEERAHWVGVVDHGRPQKRITFTYPALESSGTTLFLIQGAAKSQILDRILSGDTTLPAGRLKPQGELLWFIDKAAAGRWQEA